MASPALALKITCATENEIHLCKKKNSGHVIGGGRGGHPQLFYWGC